MSLVTKLSDLITRIGTEFKSVRTAIAAVLPALAGQDGKFLMTNGTTVSWTVPGGPFHAAGYYPGKPTAGAIMMFATLATTVNFAVNLAGSVGKSKTAATAQTDFDVQKNGVSIGTVRYAAAAAVPTFIAASTTSFAAGDDIRIIAPATPDATLADISWTLAGVR